MKIVRFFTRRPKAPAMQTQPLQQPSYLNVIEHLIEVIGETEDASDLRMLMSTLRYVRHFNGRTQAKAA